MTLVHCQRLTREERLDCLLKTSFSLLYIQSDDDNTTSTYHHSW